MFGHGFFSTIFKQADIHPKDKKNNDLIKSPEEITNDNLEETAKQDKKISQSDKNENREKRKVSAEISPEDVKKIQAKKTVSKLPVNIVQPSIDRVRTPKDAKIVYLDISKNNKTISKNIKKTLTNLNIGEAKRVSTANDILEQSKRSADSLQYISDNLIDEQNTKVTRTSDYNPEKIKENNFNIEKSTEKNNGLLGLLGPWLAKQLAKFFSTVKNFIGSALKGVWSFIKTSISKMWSFAKESKFGKMVSNGITKAKNTVSEMKDSALTKTKNVLTNVKDLGKAGIDKVTSKIPMIEKIGGKVKPVANKVYTTLKNATNFTSNMTKKFVGKIADNAIIKKAIKTVFQRKMYSVLASKIPGLGFVIGSFTSAMYAIDGDWKGATAALGSAALGASGNPAAIAAALAIDIMLLAREVYRMVYGILPDNDSHFTERINDIKEKLEKYIKGFFHNNEKSKQTKSTSNVNKAKAVIQNVGNQRFKKTPSLNNKNTQTNSGMEKPSLFNNFKASMVNVGKSISNIAGRAIDDIGNSAPDNIQLAKNILISTADVKKALTIASQKSGVPIDILQKIANIESNFKPSAKSASSSAKGLFQFTNETWSRMMKLHRGEYGLIGNESPFDPSASAFLGAAYIKDNMKQLQGIKSNLTATDMYIAHFMGAGGARNFLKAMAMNPSGNAAAMFGPAAAANKNIFYTKNGSPRTLAAIYKLFQYKMGEKMELPTINGSVQTVPQNVNSTQGTTPAPVNTGNKLSDFFSNFGTKFGDFFKKFNLTTGNTNTTSGTGGTGGLPNYNMNVTSKVVGSWKGQGSTPGLTFDRNVQTTGVKPGMLDNLAAMAADYKSRTGKNLNVTSAYRSYAVQQTLYDQAVQKYGASEASKHVAPPGKSVHGYGLGIDVGDKATMDKLEDDGTLQNYGFWRPLKNASSKEYWHIEPIGSRDSQANKNLQGDGANGNQVQQVNTAASKTTTNASDIKKNASKSINSAQGTIDKSQAKVTKAKKENSVVSNSKNLAQNSQTNNNNTVSDSQVNNNNTVINSNNDNSKGLKSRNLFRNKVHGDGK